MLHVLVHGAVSEVRLSSPALEQVGLFASGYVFDGSLIDSGPANHAGELAEWASGQHVSQVINTHYHEDHIGANHVLGLPIFAPEASVGLLADPQPIPAYRARFWGQPQPSQAVGYSDRVATANHELAVIATPGHSQDHVSLLLRQEGWLFGGDIFISEQVKYIRYEEDARQIMASLRKLLTVDFGVLFCCHAGAIRDGKAALRRKLDYWEGIQGEAERLATQGQPVEVIRDAVLGDEGAWAGFSGGEFSKLNLIRSLLGHEVVVG